jgi:alkylation response protein AidB-like acyl-CoA dehydrogenase
VRFTRTEEQADFAATLDKLLSGADTVAAARAWADGDTAAGLALWGRLAEQGVTALLVPEEADGMGATAVELVIAMEALGHHVVPGPWVETAAYLPRAITDTGLLGQLAEGTVATVAAPPHTPYAVCGAEAELVFAADGETLLTATAGAPVQSIAAARRLTEVVAGDPVATGDLGLAVDTAALATAARLLGAGERLLADSVAYVKQRRQFGREIGSYQAIKHQLADVRIALDFVRPLVDGAALADGTADFARDVSAAKVAAADAAYRASRVALQVHGAIGYTAELDLSLWILEVRALIAAWGTPAFHRTRLLDAVAGGR